MQNALHPAINKKTLSFQIDKDSPVPYYYQIEENIRSLINQDYLKPGDLLPSELILASQLGVSRITVRQALLDLTNEGLLIRRRALGTFVAYPRLVLPIIRDRLRGLTEEMSDEGLTVHSKVLEHTVIPASGELVKELKISYNQKVIRIRRLRSINDLPLVIETTHHTYARFPKLASIDFTDKSTYAILDNMYNVRPIEASDRFVADIATKEIAELLDIDIGAPVMRYKRTAKDQSGIPMEFTISIYRADLYQFVIHYQSYDEISSKGGEPRNTK